MSVLWSPIRSSAASQVEGDSVVDFFWEGAARRGASLMMREKKLGIWQEWSWADAARAVREVAYGLMELGLEERECVSILSNTRLEWTVADLAVLSANCIANGIYPTDSAEQVEYLCLDSDTVIVMVEDEEQLDKIYAVRERLPRLRQIILFDPKGLSKLSDPDVFTWERLREIGRDRAARLADELVNRRSRIRPEDTAVLVYTSGTTGKPKGAMFSHACVAYSVRGLAMFSGQDDTDERMLFLPLCHAAERFLGQYYAIYTGTRMNFVEKPETVPENVQEIAPTVLLAVPRVWEKFHSAVMLAVDEAGRCQRLLYRWAIGIGRRIADLVVDGHPVPWHLKIRFRIARWLALDNIRKFVGIHRCRYLITGAAPISPDLIRWYLALGFPMMEVWGQTEAGGLATAMPLDRIKPGSIGVACPHTEVRLDPETGELLVRGPNVFGGYRNLPDKTREALGDDGWLRTGDVGRIDADGYFQIVDRMKDIIITAGGKNITPSEWENEIKFSPYVTDAVVIGDRRPFLAALILIDHENVEKYAQDHDVPFSNYTSLTRAPEVHALIQGELDKVNRKFARVEQIRKFRLLENQITAEDEEMTATMKLKRKFVESKYSAVIDEMYRN